MNIVEKFIAYASWYIGKKEKPGNSGFIDPAFEKEMVKAGWRKGDPWCATFIKMVFRKLWTGDLLAAVNLQFNASAKQTFDRVKAAGIFETGDQPEPGAVVVWLHGHGPSGHEGMVKSVSFETNTMHTIEGNTNDAGNREGEVVALKPRTIKRAFSANNLNVYGYIYPRLKK
ncbi:MAG TPA: CHAP domain-containing protein [Pedobacter sp.]